MTDQKLVDLIPADCADWLRESLAGFPAPTADMDAAVLAIDDARAFEQSVTDLIPRAYRWAKRDAPDLAGRVLNPRTPDNRPLTLSAVLGRARGQGSIVIKGPGGAGKTSIVCAMLREWAMAHRVLPMFVDSRQLGIARIQTRAGTGEAEIVRQAMHVPLLVIDDLGAELSTATNANGDVIFERHAQDRPTWITTGMKGSDLASTYGAGILRRITERTTTIVVGAQKS